MVLSGGCRNALQLVGKYQLFARAASMNKASLQCRYAAQDVDNTLIETCAD